MKAREAAVKDRDAKFDDCHGKLETMERSLEMERAELDAKAKVLAEDRVAFAKMEKRARAALKTLYESGLEEPLAGTEDGPAQLLPFLVKALEEVMTGVGPMAEVEVCVLSSAVLTRVFSHIHLGDPDANLDDLLEHMDSEHFVVAAKAVKSQVEALLGKFRAFATAPMAGDVDLAASGGGAGGSNTTMGVEPVANDGVVQG